MKKQLEVLNGVISLLSPRKKKKYAIHMELLAAKLSTSPRMIRMAIEEIRRENLIEGYVVVSDLERGYWLSKDEKEVTAWLKHYLAKALSAIKTAKHAKKFLSKANSLQGKMKF